MDTPLKHATELREEAKPDCADGNVSLLQSVTPLLDYYESKLHCLGVLRLVAIASFLLLGLAIIRDHFITPSEGEPFVLFQGVSTWPTEILLLSAILLSIFLWCHGYYELRRNFFDLSRQYRLPLVETATKDKQRSSTDPVVCTIKDGCSIWREYQETYRLGQHKARVLRWTVAFGLRGWLLLFAFNFPNRPTRGCWNEVVDAGLLLLALLASGWLTFFVWDASGRCRKLIRQLTPQPGVQPASWPPEVIGRITDREGLQEAPVYEWFNIQVIATHTKALDRFVFYPFLVLSLITLAHSPIFDRWILWQPAVLLLLFNAAVALIAVIQLTRAARTARNGAVAVLRDRLRARYALQADPKEPDTKKAHSRRERVAREVLLCPEQAKNRVELLKYLINELEGMREGAFAKFTQRPVLSAISVFCAAWLFRILDYTTKW